MGAEKTVEMARTIGVKTLVILSLSSMLGSGIFLLPAFAHEVVGPGMWFAFDMGAAREITSIVLDCQGSAFDYPRRYSVEVSDDGTSWSEPIVQGQSNHPMLDIMLPGTKTRHVRISQHGFAEGKFWSIHKLEVYTQ